MSPDKETHTSRTLTVTFDARALDGTRMGTQVHVLELVRALARGGRLELRVLVRGEKIDRDTLGLLSGLPDTEILDARDVTEDTRRSAVFHRPLQTFSPEDVALACDLGERIVLSQLDLIAYGNPDYFPDAQAYADYRRASRHGMVAAERVVVFSAHTRGELLARNLVEDERIAIVAPGLDHRPPTAEPRRPAGLEERADGGFLLCLGADYAHKNRVFALELLAQLRARHGWRGELVFVGAHVAHGSSQRSERELLDAHPELRASVSDLGPVDEAEKAWLTARTAAIVYPSLYEGFGLVPFESGLQGVPCLFAARSSLAEGAIAKAATILPEDPVRSAAAAHPLLVDPEARAAHVRTLAEAAQGLTWERAATAMLEIYREAACAPVRIAATLSRDAVARERELAAARREVVQMLIDERELVLHDYNELLAEVGAGRSLIGPRGSLPEDLQRALLALSAHPALSRPLYGLAAGLFAIARAVARAVRRPFRRA
ncbi:MAG TPA: glycosyltransferase [Solirubrobacteraceae bacterium]|jgi:glycosyltransferase involved in cell wall biosynthesis